MDTKRPMIVRFGIAQQMIFARRLSLYLHSGIPIARALSYIAEDSKSSSSRYIIQSLEKNVAAGLPLSRGLSEFPKQFSAFTIGFVRAGEASGTLSKTLERLAIALNKQDKLRQKILSALAYPALIFCGTISIAVFLTLFIFPKIIPVLKGFHTTLPFSTRLLISINSVFAHHWLLILVLFLIVLLGLIFSLRFYRVTYFLEHALLYIPIFSSLYKYYAIATFSRTLSLQLKGGVRIITALVLVRDSLSGILYPAAVTIVENMVANGQRFSFALRQHPRLFPAVVCQMVAAGETTGTLSANLESLADMYEEHVDELAKNLTVMIEPVLMVCMGFVVGFIALAIITPIYAVTQNLNIK